MSVTEKKIQELRKKESSFFLACRICKVEKPTKDFSPSKSYCIECTKAALEAKRPGAMKKLQQITPKEKVTQKKEKYCVFCKAITENYYKENRLTRYTCKPCKTLLTNLLAHKTRQLTKRVEIANQKLKEVKEELAEYRAEIKGLIKAYKTR